MEDKKSYSFFLKITGIVAAVIVILIVAGLSVFWKYLECYQLSTETTPISELFEYIKSEDYETAYNLADKNHKYFDSVESFREFSDLNFKVNLNNLRFSKASSKEDNGEIKYSVYSDGNKILSLNVIKSDVSVGFGLKSFEISKLNIDFIDDINVSVPENASLIVNGKLIDSSTAAKKLLDNTFIGLNEDECPVIMEYKLSGYISYPEISVMAGDKPCTAVSSDDKFNIVYGNSIIDDENTSVYTEFAMKACKAYASFITKDGTRLNLLNYIYKKSSFYKDMQQYENQWYGGHTAMKFSEEEITSAFKYDDNHYSVSMKMKQSMKRGGNLLESDLVYTANIIVIDGNLKIVNIMSK